MVRWPRLVAQCLIDLTCFHPRGKIRRQQKVVDADSSIVLECLAEVVPERELSGLSRMQGSESICVAQSEQGPIARTRFRLKQCIVNPRCRLVAIDVFRDHIEVASDERWHFVLKPKIHLLFEPVHPSQLVRELLRSNRIAVGR
jgi:hypothetical protein